MRHGEILRAVGRGQVLAVYGLFSPERTLRDEFLRHLLGVLLPEALRELNVEVVDGSAGDAADILGRLRTLPVLAPRRVVVVRDADLLPGAEAARLAGGLERPPSTGCLILVGEKLDQRTRLARVLAERGRLLAFPRLRGPELAARLREEAEKRGKRLTPEAEALLLQLLGEDLPALLQTLEKADLFAGPRPVIEAEDVGAVAAQGRAGGIFELTDAVGRRKAGEALGSLRALLLQGEEPLKLLGMLARHWRLLVRARLLTERGQGGAAAENLGLPPRVSESLLDQAGRFSLEELEAGFRILRRADLDLKGATRSTAWGLERLVWDLAGGVRTPGRASSGHPPAG